MSRWLAFAALGLLALGVSAGDGPARADESFAPPDARGWGRAGGLEYLELVRGADPDERLPMLVLIHGLGDEPHEQWLELVDAKLRVRVILPRAPEPYGSGYAWFPFRIGQHGSARIGQQLEPRAQQLAAALKMLQARRPTRGMPVIAGFSQGGMLSFALAVGYPERFSLVVPISGLLPDALWPKHKATGAAAKLPIRSVHGANDRVVPIEPARALVKHLRSLGYDASLREYAGLDHSIAGELRSQVVRELAAAVRKQASAPALKSH